MSKEECQVSGKENARKGLKNSWQHNTWELKSEKEFIKVKKILSKSRKSSQNKNCHDQEKVIKTKRTSQRYNPKDSGNYQEQITMRKLLYGTQKNKKKSQAYGIRDGGGGDIVEGAD